MRSLRLFGVSKLCYTRMSIKINKVFFRRLQKSLFAETGRISITWSVSSSLNSSYKTRMDRCLTLEKRFVTFFIWIQTSDWKFRQKFRFFLNSDWELTTKFQLTNALCLISVFESIPTHTKTYFRYEKNASETFIAR